MKNILLALLLLCASCIANAPVVGSVVSTAGFVKYDGTVLVARGSVSGEAILYWKGTGLPLYPPIVLAADKTIVVNHQTNERLELSLTEPLPAYCAPLFRVGEADALGVSFVVPQPE